MRLIHSVNPVGYITAGHYASELFGQKMKVTLQNLKRFRDDKELVSIRRDGCDDRKIQAFVIHFTDTLVLLQYIFDFYVDGIMLLRLVDITSIETTVTDEFQKRLLIQEGVFAKIGFGYRPPIRSYDVFLRSLPNDEIVILEDELADDPVFIIGTLQSVDVDKASIRFFTGAANWQDAPSVIEIARITSCQIKTNYINFYARHFERSKAK